MICEYTVCAHGQPHGECAICKTACEIGDLKAKLDERGARIEQLQEALGVAYAKLDSFKETGGVRNDGDELGMEKIRAALKGGQP